MNSALKDLRVFKVLLFLTTLCPDQEVAGDVEDCLYETTDTTRFLTLGYI